MSPPPSPFNISPNVVYRANNYYILFEEADLLLVFPNVEKQGNYSPRNQFHPA